MISGITQNRFNAPQRLQNNTTALKLNFGNSVKPEPDSSLDGLGGVAVLCAGIGLFFHCAMRDISAAVKEEAAKKIVIDSLNKADSVFKAVKK